MALRGPRADAPGVVQQPELVVVRVVVLDDVVLGYAERGRERSEDVELRFVAGLQRWKTSAIHHAPFAAGR